MSEMSPAVIKLTSEPVLDGVHDEDRPTVRNVIYVMHALKLCLSWSVTPKNQGYEVTGSIDTRPATVTDIELRDMELIRKVDPLRVTSVATRVLGGSSPTLSLTVFILRKSEPVIMEEQEIVHIQRKRKFWYGSGSQ